jgi:hypothetical protein
VSSIGGRVPLADAGDVRNYLRRGRIVRLALVLALGAVGATVVLVASGLKPTPAPLAPPGTSAVLVVDVSSSITSNVYRQIEHTLHEAATSGERYGLVLFSDIAYEALPPGTPADALDAYRRFFTPLTPAVRAGSPQPTASDLTFPTSPWATSFSGGTRISSGLALALEILQRDRLEGRSVVLVSDLADDGSDLPALAEVLGQYDRFRIPFRVVALSASRQDRALFASLLRGDAKVTEAPKPPRSVEAPLIPLETSDLSRGLVVLAALLLVLLALNELALGRLRWGGRA